MPETEIPPATRVDFYSLLPILGGKPIKELSAADLQAAIDRAKKQDYSRQTILCTKSAAVQIERFALSKGIISELRLNDITLDMGKSKGVTETLSEEETALMLERSTGHKMCIPALLILLCGMRVGELRALTWADIKDKKLTVNKTVANGKRQPTITEQSERTVPVPSVMYRITRSFPHDDGLICPNTKGQPMTDAEFARAWKSYCRFLFQRSNSRTEQQRVSELVFFKPANVRQTYAKFLFASGMNIREIQYLLGHTTLEMTMKLAERFLTVDMKHAAERLEGYLDGERC